MHDGAQRLQTFIRQVTGSADIVVTPADVVARSAHAIMASAEEWAAIRDIQERLPERPRGAPSSSAVVAAPQGRAEPSSSSAPS